jgi:hypothetical protein
MSDPRKDDHLDEDLKADLQALSAAYRAAPDLQEPPAALDDAIRAAARRAVSAGPRPIARTWLSRSSTPLAAAAVLVLTVSIGFLSLDDPNVPVKSKMDELSAARSVQPLPEAQAPEAPPSAQAKAETPRERIEVTGAVAIPEPPKPALPSAVPKSSASADTKLRYSNEPAAAAPGAGLKVAPPQYVPAPPPPPSPTVSAVVVAPPAPVPVPAAPPAPVAPPAPIPSQPAAPLMEATPTPPPATATARPSEPSRAEPKREGPATVSAPQSIGEIHTQTAKQKEQTPPAKQFAPDPSSSSERIEITGSRTQADQARAKRDMALGAAARNEAERRSGDKAADKGADRFDARESDNRVLAKRALEKPAEKAASAAAPAPAVAPASSGDDVVLAPDDWVKRIVELQRQGKTKEAAEELKKFKKRYPDYALPADLRDLK